MLATVRDNISIVLNMHAAHNPKFEKMGLFRRAGSEISPYLPRNNDQYLNSVTYIGCIESEVYPVSLRCVCMNI